MEQRSGLANMVIGAILLACGVFPATVSAEILLKVGGTGSALGTMKLLAEIYEKSHPGVRVRIMPSLGSTGGIKSLLGGGIDVGLVSRPLEETERRQGALAQEYARSPFVFITHPGVNKKNVTTQELEGFYSNPAASWPDGRRTRLILRPEKDIDSKLIRNLSPGMELALKAALERPGMILAVTDQESTDAVARTPGALGCTTLNEIISGNKKLNVLSFNGLESHAGTTANSFYPLIKTFYLVTTLKSSAEARQFAEFVRSPAAGRVLKKTGHLTVIIK